MVQDYSGIAKAGEIQGQMYAQLGKDIGGTITNVSQIMQQNKQMQGQVDSASKGYASLAKAFPDQAEFFNTQAGLINNPDVSLTERFGVMKSGESIFATLNQMNAMQLNQEKLAISRMNAGGGGDTSRGGR